MDLKQKLKKELERKSQFKKVQKHTAVGSSLNGPKLSRPALSRTNTLEKKLSGAEFRFINQKLYTCTSKEAVKLFKTSPELFDVYHKGFRLQSESWSANPNDSFLEYLKSKPEELVIADMGCGEGFLAKSLPQRTIHSFDLVAANEFVVACDIAHVPLDDKSVDIVIFSLSLMGTNFVAFILEARRILKRGGELKIAEVSSRILDMDVFIRGIESMGFTFKGKNEPSKMFVFLDFSKVADSTGRIMENLTLKPCLYKRR